MAQLTELGRALAHLRGMLGFTLDTWARQVGRPAETLAATEHGSVEVEALGRIARLCALDEEGLREGMLMPAEGASVFLLHSSGMDFDARDLAALDRAMHLARGMTACAVDLDGGLALQRRLEFVPVAPAGPAPRDAAQQGHRLARHVRARLGLRAEPVEDMRALLEETFGIAVVVDDLVSVDLRAAAIRDRHRAAGAAVLASHDPHRDENPVLARVYLAHELCHILFDPAPPGSVRLVLDDGVERGAAGTGAVARLESRAKGFAAEFLIPSAGLEDLLGERGDSTLSLEAARGMVGRVREHFSTPWEVAMYQLINQGYVRSEYKLDLLKNKPRPAKPRHLTTLPAAGQAPERLTRRLLPTGSTERDELVYVDGAQAEARSAMGSLSLRALGRARDAVAAGRELEAVDILVEHLDDVFLAGEFEVAGALLAQVDPHEFPARVLTGILTISAHARAELGDSRDEFFWRVMVALRDTWRLDPEQLHAVEARLR